LLLETASSDEEKERERARGEAASHTPSGHSSLLKDFEEPSGSHPTADAHCHNNSLCSTAFSFKKDMTDLR
jgi:hypothetical protein